MSTGLVLAMNDWVTLSNLTPIWYGSVQPAMSYGPLGRAVRVAPVRVGLRVHQVDDVGAERLRLADDEAARRVGLVAHLEGRLGLLDVEVAPGAGR